MHNVRMAGTFTEQSESQSLLLQLMDQASRADPYPLYARCREHGPIALPGANFTIFSTYRDCDEVLGHPSSSSDPRKSTLTQQGIAGPAPGLLPLDPPHHTRLRKLFNKAFVPKVINELKPEITAMVDGMLDRIAERGRFDAIADLAHPLPVTVICRLLTVPLGDEPKFSHASAVLANAMDPLVPMTEELMWAYRWLQDYLYGLIEQRRAHPGDDFMSGLIAVEESGDQLSQEEIVSITTQLLVAGHETTTGLLANAILALLRHPRQWAALGADGDRAAAVIEETLRYDSPVHLIGRHAADDMIIGDTRVVKGDTMVLLPGSANRDPAEYERPDTFDPDRKAFRHLAFGRGTHLCVGAPLARMEAAIVLPALTTRFPKAQLDGELRYKPSFNMRGLFALPVAV